VCTYTLLSPCGLPLVRYYNPKIISVLSQLVAGEDELQAEQWNEEMKEYLTVEPRQEHASNTGNTGNTRNTEAKAAEETNKLPAYGGKEMKEEKTEGGGMKKEQGKGSFKSFHAADDWANGEAHTDGSVLGAHLFQIPVRVMYSSVGVCVLLYCVLYVRCVLLVRFM
jgi:hypothetical protein